MNEWIIAAGVAAVALAVMYMICLRAPLGYQDENGFHFGREPTEEDDYERAVLMDGTHWPREPRTRE